MAAHTADAVEPRQVVLLLPVGAKQQLLPKLRRVERFLVPTEDRRVLAAPKALERFMVVWY